METLKFYIQDFLNQLIQSLNSEILEFNYYDWKILKSRLSGKLIAEKLGINESMITEFENSLENFDRNEDNPETNYTCALRLSLWIETISKNTRISFNPIFKEVNGEDIAIKQVRAIELIIRSLIDEQIGGNEKIISILNDLFKSEIIEKWIKSSDHSGILSGTTFSELSNILLHKNIFVSFEDIFDQNQIKITKDVKESIRLILEDIRLIRNSVAHNKALSNVQIEALNNHYAVITRLISESKKSNIDVKVYFDQATEDIKGYIAKLSSENQVISGYISDVNEKTDVIAANTKRINRKTSIIIGITAIILLISGAIFFSQKKTEHQTKKIEENVTKVYNRFDQIEGALKTANPIANPKTANDFILNAYLFKNAGETEKSIEMFEKYFHLTKNNKFDLYNDYYQLLKANFTPIFAAKSIENLPDQNMAKAVIYINELYGMEAITKINQLKISEYFKKYLFVLKSSEIESDYIGMNVYAFFNRVMSERISLGKSLDGVLPFFFDSRAALRFLKDRYWDDTKKKIIIVYKSIERDYKLLLKNSNLDMFEQLKLIVEKQEDYTIENIRQYEKFYKNSRQFNQFMGMP